MIFPPDYIRFPRNRIAFCSGEVGLADSQPRISRICTNHSLKHSFVFICGIWLGSSSLVVPLLRVRKRPSPLALLEVHVMAMCDVQDMDRYPPIGPATSTDTRKSAGR